VPNIRRSLFLSFAQNYTGMLITIPSIMILARFLTPAETGIFSVAMAVTNLTHVLRDFGVGGYLIQEREITREKIRAAFTIALSTA
jgi:O-antigen/teichoic acid export membrane protein